MYAAGSMGGKKRTWGGRRTGAGRKPVLDDPVRYSMDLEKAQMARLTKIAKKRESSVATVVREAVDAYLARRGGR